VTDWTKPASYPLRFFSVLLTLLAVAIPVLVVFASLLGVVANFLLLRASRRILYSLVTTYVAGPGAHEWEVAQKRNVIALPIPRGVTTLSFDMLPKKRRALIESARLSTRAKLEKILGRNKVPVSSLDPRQSN
jgi:hypothetical protein